MFFFLAVIVLMFWLSGSHGHIQVRSGMIEDWILSGIVLASLILSSIKSLTVAYFIYYNADRSPWRNMYEWTNQNSLDSYGWHVGRLYGINRNLCSGRA